MRWFREWVVHGRSAVRTLWRNRLSSLAIVTVTALAVAVLATVFTVTRGVLFRQFMWLHPELIVQATEFRRGNEARIPQTVSNATYHAWREHGQQVVGVGAWRTVVEPVTLDAGELPIQVNVVWATPELFDVLGVRAGHGRWFTDETGQPEILLSHALWRGRLGGNPGVVGSFLAIDGVPHQVTGIMPEGFVFPDRHVDAWTRWSVPTALAPGGGTRLNIVGTVARLRHTGDRAAAEAEATALATSAPDAGAAAVALFGAEGPITIGLTPIVDALAPDVRQALRIVIITALVLFAAVMVNLSGVQLARATGRTDLILKHVMGASTGRLAGEVLAENLLLASLGGALGLWLTGLLAQAAPHLLPPEFPRAEAIAVDAGTIMFGLGAALVAGLTFGVGPLVVVSRLVRRSDALAVNGKGSNLYGTPARSAALRTILLCAQTATAFALVVGAFALRDGYLSALHADRGYSRDGMFGARLAFPWHVPREQRLVVAENVVADLRQMPGITGAGLANSLPLLSIGGVQPVAMAPVDTGGPATEVPVMTSVVDAGYFNTLGIMPVAGRVLADNDVAGAPRVVVVNRTFASLLPGTNAIDQTIPLHLQGEDEPWRVVGVVDDVRHGALTEPRQPEVFVPYRQVDWNRLRVADPIVVLRSQDDTVNLMPLLQSSVRRHSPDAALDSAMSMNARIDRSLGRTRLYAWLIGVLALVSACIAAAGLFATATQSVTRRSREFAIRTALGASRRHVVWTVAASAVAVAVAGIIAGAALTSLLEHNLAAMVPGTIATAWPTLAGAAVTIVAVVLLALARPLWRATRHDLTRTLAAE